MKVDNAAQARTQAAPRHTGDHAPGGGRAPSPTAGGDASTRTPTPQKHEKATLVFKISLVISLLIVVVCAVFPDGFQAATAAARSFIGENFGWYYLLLVATIVLLCLVLMLSPVGRIRLGTPGTQPEYSRMSWVAMLFSAGMGIGLVFWGAAEPLAHYATSAPEAPVGSVQALTDSFRYSFFHWGISAWALYGIIGLALGYFMFRKKEKPLLSVTLKPILGKKAEGGWGKAVDIMTVFATIAGIGTSLGLGAMQINGGLSYLFGVPNNAAVQLIIIAITTVCFIASAVSGLSKGLKYLSNANVILAVALVAAAMIVGPTAQMFNTFVTATGEYLQNFIAMSFNVAPFDSDQHAWIESWTIFYWAWWIAWSPFVGMFIARISKGRTVREFLFFVIMIPSIFSTIWFATFGTLSTSVQASGVDLTGLATETVLFGTFANYPAGQVLSIVALVLIFSFFITSADSATFVLGMITEDGNPSPHKRTKILWGIMLSVIAALLLLAGGLDALQNALIITAFPFSIVMILVAVALVKELHHEREIMGLYVHPTQWPRPDEPIKSYEDQEYRPRFMMNDLTTAWKASDLHAEIERRYGPSHTTLDAGLEEDNDDEVDRPL